VVAIGLAQEFQRVWRAYRRQTRTAAPQFTFAKADRQVTCCHLWDQGSGPACYDNWPCASTPAPDKHNKPGTAHQ
jgi:hypothetical protein